MTRTARGRAANGRSSISRDTQGRWHGYVSMGHADDGTPVRRHVRAATRDEVTRKVQALEAERDRSAGRATTGAQLSFGDWLEEWLVIVQRTRKPKTFDNYTSLTRRHCVGLRRRALGKVTVRDIDDLLHRVAQSAPQSAVSLHRILRSCFNTALKRGLVGANPCQHAVVPRVREVEVEPYDTAQCHRILAAACDGPNPARWSVALALGLRQGEALGLQWADVDLEGRQLRVRRQLQRRGWHHGCGEAVPEHRPSQCPGRTGGGWVFEDVKSRAGRRTVALPDQLAEQLRTHRATQHVARLAAGPAWHDWDLVFPRADGHPQHYSTDAAAWDTVLATAGVPRLRLHTARHTAATMLLAQGVDGRVVMSVLGWSQPSLLMRYQHVVDPMRRDAATRIGQAYWPDAGGAE